MAFVVQSPDYTLSPYTGMVKKHWLDAGQYLLEGIFTQVPLLESPIVLKRHEQAITYPREGDPNWRYVSEKFEGLARSFLIAGPLLANLPDIHVAGICLRDYYKLHVLLLADERSELYIGNLDEMRADSGHESRFQHTCECASLVINLDLTRQYIWDTYSQAEKDRIARVLSRWGHYLTCAQNWRLFNILVLSFLKKEGYAVDDTVLKDHLMHTLSFYTGDGWYRDGGLFDYYSSWAFQFYAPVWCRMFGYDNMRAVAESFERKANELIKTYDRFFDRDGKMSLWGRSGIYRFGASAPFGVNFLLENPAASPGLARRILSGNLYQFISKDTLFNDGQMCIGFYSPFPPMVQQYSCAASPYWAANSFHALSLPDGHPLWSARESNGVWESLGDRTITTTVPGPGISVVNYGKSGMTEMRTSRFSMYMDHPWLQNYSRLAFSTDLLWEANAPDVPDSMHLSLFHRDRKLMPNLFLYGGDIGNVFYRRLVYDFSGDYTHNVMFVDMAEYAYPEGTIRFDRLHFPEAPFSLVLTHYGLPHAHELGIRLLTQDDAHAVSWSEDGELSFQTKAHPDASLVASTPDFELGLNPLFGWEELGVFRKQGVNPPARDSVVLNTRISRKNHYQGMPFLISVLSHKKNGKLTYSETNPVRDISVHEISERGGPWSADITLVTGESFSVDYSLTEGNYGF